MKISLCPSFYCNFRCPWCYLSNEQLSSKRIINISELTNTINYINLFETITHIDIYGGEPTLLPVNWSIDLINLLRNITNAHLHVITNLSSSHHPLLFLSDTIGISYDFDKRQQWIKVREKIRVFPHKKHVVTLVNELHHIDDIDAYIEDLMRLNIDSWELKPFSVSKFNSSFKEDFSKFEIFVKTVIDKAPPFEIINEINMNNVSSSFSDDHIYIMPDSKMYVLDFDENFQEYFKNVSTIEDFYLWTKKEFDEYTNNKTCSNCTYLGNCLSEHLKVYNNTCNGFPDLIKWYHERN